VFAVATMTDYSISTARAIDRLWFKSTPINGSGERQVSHNA
jgi:hypothetical protein